MTNTADTRIKTILSADSANFEAGFARAVSVSKQAEGKFLKSNKVIEGSFTQIAGSVTGLAAKFGVAFSVGALVAFGKKIIDTADNLQTLSDRSNASASFFSGLQAQIENSGGSLEDLGTSLKKMSATLGEAAGGAKGARDNFRALGLDFKSLQGLSSEDQFYKIADAIAKLGTHEERVAASTAIFGKGIASLIPTVELGGEALRKLVEAQIASGTAVSDQAVARVDAFGDAIHTMGVAASNAAVDGLGSFLLYLDKLDAEFQAFLARHNIKQNNPSDVLKAIDDAKNGSARQAYQDKAAAAQFNGHGFVSSPTKGSVGLDLQKEFDAKNPPKGKKKLFNTTDADKAATSTDSFTKSFQKMQNEVDKGIATSGLSDLDAKVIDVRMSVEDLAERYGVKLTPAMIENEKHLEETTKKLYQLNLEQKRTDELANSLGDAFSTAFDEATDGAHKFSDVLGDLGNTIEKALFKNVVGDPLNQLISGFTKSALSGTGGSGGGLAGIFSSIYSALPSFSFATGVSNVPYDMNARIHKGESVLSAQETRNGSGGDIVVNVINNAGAKVGTSQKQNGNSTELTVMIDQAVAKNIANRNSATSTALSAMDSRTLTRR